MTSPIASGPSPFLDPKQERATLFNRQRSQRAFQTSRWIDPIEDLIGPPEFVVRGELKRCLGDLASVFGALVAKLIDDQLVCDLQQPVENLASTR